MEMQESRVFACSFSPVLWEGSSALAALAVENGNVELWKVDLTTNKRQAVRVKTATHGVDETLRTAWSQDGSLLVSGGSDGRLCFWDDQLVLKATIELQVNDPEDQAVYATWFSHHRKEVCVAYDDMLCGYNVENGCLAWKHEFGTLKDLISSRNPLGKRLVFDAHEQDELGLMAAALSDGTVCMVDPKCNKLVKRVAVHCKATSSCRFSHGAGSSLVTGSTDGTVCVWDTRTWWRRFATPNLQSPVYGVQFLDENEILTWAGSAIRSWNTNGTETQVYQLDFPVICVDDRHETILACGMVDDCSSGDRQSNHHHHHVENGRCDHDNHGEQNNCQRVEDDHSGHHHCHHDEPDDHLQDAESPANSKRSRYLVEGVKAFPKSHFEMAKMSS